MTDKTGQKSGRRWKKREENHFDCLKELILEHVTVNETGAYVIPPDHRDKYQYFVYILLFYKQPVYKQTALAC